MVILEKVYIMIVNDVCKTLLVVIVLCISGYVFKDLADSCERAYTIKKNYDTEAYIYAVLSVFSFLCVGILSVCLFTYQINSKDFLQMLNKNEVHTEVRTENRGTNIYSIIGGNELIETASDMQKILHEELVQMTEMYNGP